MSITQSESSISDRDKRAIRELRERLPEGLLSPYYDTDFNFLRWLQGYDFHVEDVLPRLIHHLRVRKAWALDHLVESERETGLSAPVQFMMKYWPTWFGGPTGKAANNYVFWIEWWGKLDSTAFLKCVSALNALRKPSYGFEVFLSSIMKQEQATGRQSGLAMILDLDGLKLDQELIYFITGPFKCLADYICTNYVELIKTILVINSPSYMYYIWKLVRPIIPGKTFSKIRDFDRQGWKQELLQDIDANRLPPHYGGTLETATFSFPEPVPKDFYRLEAEEEREFLNSRHLQSLAIKAQRAEFLTVKVENPGDVISWYLLTNRQFGFGVFYSEKKENEEVENMDMVFPRFNQTPATAVPIKESLLCEKLGFYKFWFSNHNAWFLSLKVDILVEISHGDSSLHSNVPEASEN